MKIILCIALVAIFGHALTGWSWWAWIGISLFAGIWIGGVLAAVDRNG